MRKILIKEPFKIEIIEAPDPKLETACALIKTKYIGICGSDLIKFTGKYKNLVYPVTPGHEFTGIIKDIENNKYGFKIGDAVAINPNLSCGKCIYCLENKNYLCRNLKTLGANNIDGAMQDFINVPLRNIYKIDNEDLEKLTLSEPLSVAIHPILNLGIKDKILFFGLGGIGTLGLLYLKGRIKNISVVELNKIQIDKGSPLETYEIFYYDFLIKNSKKFSEKFDSIIINCPFTQEIFDISTELVKRGGEIIIIGLSTEDIKIDFIRILNKEISISTSYKFSENDFKTAVKFLKSDNSIFNLMKIRTFLLENSLDAFNFKINNPGYKILLENNED